MHDGQESAYSVALACCSARVTASGEARGEARGEHAADAVTLALGRPRFPQAVPRWLLE
jgi:hypothetical protein